MSDRDLLWWLPERMKWLKRPLLVFMYVTTVLYVVVLVIGWLGYLYSRSLHEEARLAFIEAAKSYLADQVDTVSHLTPWRLRDLFVETLTSCDYGVNFACAAPTKAQRPSPTTGIPVLGAKPQNDSLARDICKDNPNSVLCGGEATSATSSLAGFCKQYPVLCQPDSGAAITSSTATHGVSPEPAPPRRTP